MTRVYNFSAEIDTSTSAIDLLELIGAASKIGIIHELSIGLAGGAADAGDAQAEQLAVTLTRFSGGHTSGSGGSSVTGRPLDPGDAAASVTCEAGNSTACTGGTSVEIHRDGFAAQAGWQWTPTPECRPIFAASSALVLRLATAPADALKLEVSAKVEEIG